MAELSINLLNSNNVETQDTCSICLNELNLEHAYELPECLHCFHTNCVMHWFRQGNSKCPLCNNNGVIPPGAPWSAWKSKFTYLRSYSRKKEVPKLLKNKIKSIKKQENKIKLIKKQIKELKSSHGEFNKLYKEYKSLFNKQRRAQWSLRKKKIALVDIFNIVPIIIVKNQEINYNEQNQII